MTTPLIALQPGSGPVPTQTPHREPQPVAPTATGASFTMTAWTTQQLVAFLGNVSACRDEATALQTAAEAVASATDSEIGAVVIAGAVRSCIGFGRHPVRRDQLVAACTDPTAGVTIPGHGPGETLTAELGRIADGHLLAVRAHGAFSAGERGMVAAMANVLGLTLDVLAALEAERTLRESSERTTRQVTDLLGKVREQRQLTLDRFSRIQRAIAARNHLTEVLDAITTTACELVECNVAVLRLTVNADLGADRFLVSTAGLEDVAAQAVSGSYSPVGIGRLAENATRPLVDNDFTARPEAALFGTPPVSSAIAVAVRHGSTTIGHLLLGSRVTGHRFTPLDEALATTLAEHAGLAVQDAQTVEELHLALDEARHRASHDPLTTLANRTTFLATLDRALAAPTGTASRPCLLFVDLDHFKAANDTYGHLAGDRLLVTTANRLRELAGPDDLVARLGGDEFVVLLAAATQDQACGFAEGLLTAIGRPVHLDEHTITPSASIGVAPTRPGDSPTEVLIHADLALYEAKRLGRKRFALYRPGLDGPVAEHSATAQPDPVG